MSQHVIGTTSDFFIKRMKRLSGSGFYRENMFGHELIWNRIRYTFDDKQLTTKKEIQRRNRDKSHLFIFALVKRDAEKYISIKKPHHADWLASIHNNPNARKGVSIVGTDVDGAYWRIAWHLGVISDKTYHHGMRINDKEICLAALANLGSDKTYQIVDNGNLSRRFIVIRGNKLLKAAYTMIRYTCFTFMQELAKMLGNDFFSYKTDAIYYAKNQRNVALVTGFLDDHELDHKMIGYNRLHLKKA